MEFFKKLFNKKTTAEDILLSLNNFSSDTKSLTDFTQKATEFFGSNWKFNTEFYISSLPEEEKNIYLPIFKTVLEYEKGLQIWSLSEQLLKGTTPLTSDIIKSLPEYEFYLNKFGIEGKRVLEKLKSMLNIKTIKPTEEIISEKNDEGEVEIVKDSMPLVKEEIKEVEVKQENAIPNKEPEPRSPKQEEYVATLKSKILKKVKDMELLNQDMKKDEIVNPSQSDNASSVADEKVSKKANVESNFPSDTNDDTNWDIRLFVKIHNFLSKSREIMSAISLYKNTETLEDYKGYGFILDTIDYLIFQGEKLLQNKTEEELKSYFKGGKSELVKIIDTYKSQKNDEIIISEDKE